MFICDLFTMIRNRENSNLHLWSASWIFPDSITKHIGFPGSNGNRARERERGRQGEVGSGGICIECGRGEWSPGWPSWSTVGWASKWQQIRAEVFCACSNSSPRCPLKNRSRFPHRQEPQQRQTRRVCLALGVPRLPPPGLVSRLSYHPFRCCQRN